MGKDTSVIPFGPYCYETITNDFMGLGSLIMKVCPYWETIEDKPYQGHGHCGYIEDEGPDGPIILLHGCKDCGINMELPGE